MTNNNDGWGTKSKMSNYSSHNKSKKERIEAEKITELNLCDLLNNVGEQNHNRYTILDKNNVEQPQMIIFNGKKYFCPDIIVYQDCWNDEIIMRIEVKRKDSNNENNKRFNEFYVERERFDSYYAFHCDEEMPVRIMFVVGSPDNLTDIYWQNIDTLNKNKKLVKNYFGDNPNDYYVWNLSKLKTFNLENFYKDLYEQ